MTGGGRYGKHHWSHYETGLRAGIIIWLMDVILVCIDFWYNYHLFYRKAQLLK